MSMLPANTFKRALREGRPQIGLWSTIPSPFVCEMIGGAGYDWVLLDTEHTPTDVPLMLGQLQAVAAALPAPGALPVHAVVRPACNDAVLIKRHLDLGAQSLLLPFVQNAQQARDAVRAMRYAPRACAVWAVPLARPTSGARPTTWHVRPTSCACWCRWRRPRRWSR